MRRADIGTAMASEDRRHEAAAVIGLLPAALAFVFAAALGGFESGTHALSVTFGVVVIAACAVYGAVYGASNGESLGVRDPLALGVGLRSGRNRVAAGLLPWLLLLVVMLSGVLSPVPRAGRMFLCYGPWLLLLVPAVRSALSTSRRRASTELGFSLAVIGVASWALYDWLILGSPRAAMPLGHHNLLALWLVALLPLAALPRVWQDGRCRPPMEAVGGSTTALSVGCRWLSLLAVGLGVLALLGTKSLAGAVGFCVQLLWVVSKAPGPVRGSLRKRRMVFGVTTVAAILAVVGWHRLAAVFGGGDRSIAARWQYLVAGLEGWRDRPWLGWGPGSSSWTFGLHLDSGKLAPYQTVTDAHSLPVDLFYETGLVGFGLLLVVALLWCRARRNARRIERSKPPATPLEAEARAWAEVANVALLGLLVSSTVAGFFDVMAVWIVLPLVLGVRLAAEGQSCRKGEGMTRAKSLRPFSLPYSLPHFLAVSAAVLLWGLVAIGPLRSQFAYQRAMRADTAVTQSSELAEAVRLDPHFPLSRAANGQILGDGEEALQAATDARGLAPLYLGAGFLLRDQEPLSASRGARLALRQACDLAVLDPIAPFLLATLSDPVGQPADGPWLEALARALLGEPRLLVTAELLARPDRRRAAVALLEHRTEIPLGWRAALVDAESRLPASVTLAQDPLELVLYVDEERETSLSLFAFRRPAWRKSVARISIDGRLAELIRMPPAAVLRQADQDRFDDSLFAHGCRLTPPQVRVARAPRATESR